MFCKVDAGVISMSASTDTTIDGWVLAPKETTHNQAVALTGGEYYVITDPTAVFEVPVDETAASLVLKEGESGFVVESGGTTTGYMQKVKIATGGCATPLLLIWNVDTTNHTAFVSINPAKYDYGA
jgi:hypothetical protein